MKFFPFGFVEPICCSLRGWWSGKCSNAQHMRIGGQPYQQHSHYGNSQYGGKFGRNGHVDEEWEKILSENCFRTCTKCLNIAVNHSLCLIDSKLIKYLQKLKMQKTKGRNRQNKKRMRTQKEKKKKKKGHQIQQ